MKPPLINTGSPVRRRYHFHFPGVAYAAVTVVLVLGAINGQNNLLFWIFGLAVGGLLVSGLLSGSGLMGLELERVTPAAGRVGEPLVIAYRVRNRNRLVPALGLHIEEVDGEGASWRRHMPAAMAFVASVRGGEDVTGEAVFMPTARGVARFGAVRVWSTFPFGLAKKSVTFRQPAEAAVHPRVAEVPSDSLRGTGEPGRGLVVRGRGRSGDEFFSLRDYAPGDGPRTVAWRPTAKLGRLVVRELSDRASPRVWIAPGEGTAWEAVMSAVAGLAQAGLKEDLEIGLATPSGAVMLPARSGTRHLTAILDALARWELLAPPPATLDPERVLVVAAEPGGHRWVALLRTLGVEAAVPAAPPSPSRCRALWEKVS